MKAADYRDDNEATCSMLLQIHKVESSHLHVIQSLSHTHAAWMSYIVGFALVYLKRI